MKWPFLFFSFLCRRHFVLAAKRYVLFISTNFGVNWEHRTHHQIIAFGAEAVIASCRDDLVYNWSQIQLSVYSVYLLFRLKLGMMKDEMESEGYDDAIKDTMSDYYKMVSDSQSQKSVQSSSTSEWRWRKWYNQQGRRRVYNCVAALLAVKFQTHPICSNPVFLKWLYH